MCVCVHVCGHAAVTDDREIKVAVSSGQRPDLSPITGPETSVNHIKDCVSRCWDQSPDRRPSFAGRCAVLCYDVALTFMHC